MEGDWENITYRYTASCCDQIYGRINNCASECNLGFIFSMCFFFNYKWNINKPYCSIHCWYRKTLIVKVFFFSLSSVNMFLGIFFFIYVSYSPYEFETLYVKCIVYNYSFHHPSINASMVTREYNHQLFKDWRNTMIKAFNIFHH